MTDANVDPAVIRKTQDILGKFVKKPALSDKLLRKPPFRFLHDIVSGVIRDTGYFKGLYTDTELNSDNIKDRDAKIQFLQKIIDVIKLSVDKNLSVRPSKIVAGQEPEKTNELLQCIGTIIAKKVDCSESIEIVKNAEAKQKTSNKPQKVEKPEKSKDAKPKPEKEKAAKSKDIKVVEKPAKVKDEKVKVKEKAKEKEKEKDKTKEKRKEKVKEQTKTKEKERAKKPAQAERNEKQPEKLDASQDLSLEAQFAPVVEGAHQLTKDPFGDLPSTIPPLNENGPSSGSATSNTKQVEDERKSSKKSKEETGRRGSTPKVEGLKEERRGSSKTRKENHAERRESLKPTQETDERPVRERRESLKPTQEEDGQLVKQKDQLQEVLTTENEPTKTEMIDTIDQEAKIREKESERRKSSGKRRQSVVEGGQTDEQPKRSSKRSLNRQETALVTDNKTTEAERKPQQPIPPATESTELKRQSTFTRDSTDGSRPRTSLRPPSARPPSARPGAPRRRDKNIEIILQPNEQIKMAGINVKLDNLNNELEDDADNLVVFEDSHIQDVDDFRPKETNENELDPSQQGYLVQQILETQKKLLPSEQEGGQDEKEWDAGLSHKRQTSAKNMNSLRDAIQILTRSVNPLGKFMDFLPEDIDSMHMELTMWRDNYMQTSAELKKERGLTETSIEPMKQQLAQINSNIKEHAELVDSIRARILQNSEKINKLFTEY